MGHTHFDCPTLKKTVAKEKYLQKKTEMFNKAVFSARETMAQVLQEKRLRKKASKTKAVIIATVSNVSSSLPY